MSEDYIIDSPGHPYHGKVGEVVSSEWKNLFEDGFVHGAFIGREGWATLKFLGLPDATFDINEVKPYSTEFKVGDKVIGIDGNPYFPTVHEGEEYTITELHRITHTALQLTLAELPERSYPASLFYGLLPNSNYLGLFR